jgi:hypothetical protein
VKERGKGRTVGNAEHVSRLERFSSRISVTWREGEFPFSSRWIRSVSSGVRVGIEGGD